MSRYQKDAADLARWRAQKAVDPRVLDAKHKARLDLYDDEAITTAERGTRQERFIEPE